MITNKELNAVKLSPTKKDFYQIWNELLDTAGKISERWDPTSTNESDPGIVLLKVLTAVADKLNYNIDVNTLEAFMPSAAQEESMRKLTEMLGYNMKYYQSATTEVKISYNKNTETPIQGTVVIDKFTNVKDIDDSINYITLEPLNLTSDTPSGTVTCMEGELIECETADNNIVSIFHLDDNHRYFLPETQVAENSIFITNIENNIESTEWKQVNNLNAQSLGAKVFKFGFDSQEGLPYIQFPDDISTIIEDGLRIKYIRTSGNNGNISTNILTKITTPLSWTTSESDKPAFRDVTNYTVTNIRAATNGADKEKINSAYNNFKKTIGTFDTLVTCRDYMNKIYQMVSSVDNTTPLVSNIIVSDIRSDLNRSITLGTFTSRGIEYKVIAKPSDDPKKQFTNFDLMLYPFKSTYGLNSKQEYNKSFTYDNTNVQEIITTLEDSKTMSHNFVSPEDDELVCIKNYYRLRAKINTVRKVGIVEQTNILSNVYKKLFETFNMRQVDFGEEIPYDTILKVMETADARIKNISLEEPSLTTKFMTAKNNEETLTTAAGKSYYNKLALNNVFAGRVPLFNYNTNFITDFREQAYDPAGSDYLSNYPETAATTSEQEKKLIHKLKSEFEIPIEAVENGNSLKLTEQEVIQFRAPSLKTTVTYPAYVNYYFQRDKTGEQYAQAIPATFQTLRQFLRGGPNTTDAQAKAALEYYVNNTGLKERNLIVSFEPDENTRKEQEVFEAKFNGLLVTHCAIFTFDGSTYTNIPTATEAWNIAKSDENIKFYALDFDINAQNHIPRVTAWASWLISLTKALIDPTDPDYATEFKNFEISTGEGLKGFYKIVDGNTQGQVGYLQNRDGLRFRLVESAKTIASNSSFDYYYVPRIWTNEVLKVGDTVNADKDWHTKDGLGQDPAPYELKAGTEYALREGEYFLVNWSQTKEGSDDEKEEHWKTYSKGTIIKPNFNLADSEDWRLANHSYTKQNVVNKFEAIPQLQGMFTLGTNEQVEIREIITVTLEAANTNLYWEVSDLFSTTGGYIEFPWDEEPVVINKDTREIWKDGDGEAKKETIYLAYTLKEGEYLYYTDMNKSDIAFYGFGSTIRRGTKTPDIFKYTTDDVISTEDISAQGLSAAIPWRNYNLSGEDAALTIIENQFINLTAGDELLTAHIDKEFINNDYATLQPLGASWKLAGSDTTTNLPALDLGNNYQWQVRSKLNLAVGPNSYQTLKAKAIPGTTPFKFVADKVTLINTEYENGIPTENTELVTLEPIVDEENGTAEPLSFKTNKLILSATSITDVTDKQTDEENNLEEIIADLQLKIFKVDAIKNNQGQIINLGNYGDGNFTTLNFEEQLNQLVNVAENTNLEFNLNLLIPENNFGILMFYYQKFKSETGSENATITSTNTRIRYYNEGIVNGTTYTESPYVAELQLREGINIIQVEASDVITISSKGTNKAVITFGNLDLISEIEPINPKLCYKVPLKTDGSPTNSEIYTQILTDIRAIVNIVDENNLSKNKEFYYNIPIAQNLDLEMNIKDSADTLENPLNWFNYNNINNKFVISEINTNFLTDDIIIAKSSRSNF